jgi:hypothetical protein
MKKFLIIALLLFSPILVINSFASISDQTNKISGTGNGVSTQFNFPFKIFSATDLQVYTIDSDGNTAGPYTLNTDYTVTISRVSEGGYVTFVSPPNTGWIVFIRRAEPLTQSLALATEGPLPAKQIENQLDLQMMLAIQHDEILKRCVQLPVISTLSIPYLPTPQAGYAVGWNALGTGLENINVSAQVGPAGPQGPAGPAGSGAGDVLGPSTNHDGYIPLWNGLNAKTLKDGLILDTDGTFTADSDDRVPTQKAIKTYLDANLSGLGYTPEDVANKDTTVTLGSSDTKYPSQKAVKAYADTKIGLSGDQTVAGVKTFSSFPVTPSTIPITDYQVANKVYVDSFSGTVFSAGSIVMAHSDTLVAPSVSSSYEKLKEILIGTGGTVTVDFTLTNGDLYPPVTLKGRIYVNGSAVGTERTQSEPGSITFSENVTVVAGDLVQIYGKATGPAFDGGIKNFKVKCGKFYGAYITLPAINEAP